MRNNSTLLLWSSSRIRAAGRGIGFSGDPVESLFMCLFGSTDGVARPVGFVGRPGKNQPNIAEISHRTPCPSR